MLLLVKFGLEGACVQCFDTYEKMVLPGLHRHGGRLLCRLRPRSHRWEVHLVHFRDASSFENYKMDPARAAAGAYWIASQATIEFTRTFVFPVISPWR